MRVGFEELRKQADSFQEQLAACGSGLETEAAFNQFYRDIESSLTRLEEKEEKAALRESLEKFLRIQPPAAVGEKYDHHREALRKRLNTGDCDANTLKPYAVFVALVDPMPSG